VPSTLDSDTLLLELPDQVAAALSPMRRRLLEQLVVPSSATEVAERIGLSRQKVNYHLRALETAGLVELVEERQRRGCTERIVRTRARRLVVDPHLLQGAAAEATGAKADDRERDLFSAAYQLAAIGQAFRDVALLGQGAAAADKRLALGTIEVDVGFDSPAALRAFVQEVAESIAQLAIKHGTADLSGPRREYRVLLAARPAITKEPVDTKNPQEETSHD
jgi:DNA-binding transcriptional ArsR family regulator